jgi:hypothetical protein
MKKLLYFLLLFSFKLSLASDFNKGKPIPGLPISLNGKKINAEEFAERLLNDESFSRYLITSAQNALDVYDQIVKAGGEEAYKKYEKLAQEGENAAVEDFLISYNIDSSWICDKMSESIYECVEFMKKNPEFVEISAEEQLEVLEQLQKLFSQEFIDNNPSHPLIDWIRILLNSRPGPLLIAYTHKGPNSNLDEPYKLSIKDVGDCLFGAGIAFLSSNFKALKTMWQMLSGEWTFSGIRTVVTLFIPQAKIASAIIGLVGCLVREMFW